MGRSENRSAWTHPPGYGAQPVQRPHHATREIGHGGPAHGPPGRRGQAVAEGGGAPTSEEAGPCRQSKGALVRDASQRDRRAGSGVSRPPYSASVSARRSTPRPNTSPTLGSPPWTTKGGARICWRLPIHAIDNTREHPAWTARRWPTGKHTEGSAGAAPPLGVPAPALPSPARPTSEDSERQGSRGKALRPAFEARSGWASRPPAGAGGAL